MAYTTSKTLLKQIQSGDDTAWYNFYLIYTPLIKACGNKYKLENSELDDLVQNVMLKFINGKALSAYDATKGKFRTYMGRIIVNTIIDMKRKQKSIPEGFDEAVFHDNVQELIESEWQSYIYKEALHLLRQRVTENTYQAYQMQTEHEMPPQKVAEFLHMSLRLVYDAKARCKRLLAEILKTLDD